MEIECSCGNRRFEVPPGGNVHCPRCGRAYTGLKEEIVEIPVTADINAKAEIVDIKIGKPKKKKKRRRNE